MSGLIWIQTVWQTLMVFLKDFFKNVNLKKQQQKTDNKKACKITQHAKLKHHTCPKILLPYLPYVFGQTGLSKQFRPRWDAAERGVSSGSTLFATHPAIFTQHWVVNCTGSNFRTYMVRSWGVRILWVNTVPVDMFHILFDWVVNSIDTDQIQYSVASDLCFCTVFSDLSFPILDFPQSFLAISNLI